MGERADSWVRRGRVTVRGKGPGYMATQRSNLRGRYSSCSSRRRRVTSPVDFNISTFSSQVAPQRQQQQLHVGSEVCGRSRGSSTRRASRDVASACDRIPSVVLDSQKSKSNPYQQTNVTFSPVARKSLQKNISPSSSAFHSPRGAEVSSYVAPANPGTTALGDAADAIVAAAASPTTASSPAAVDDGICIEKVVAALREEKDDTEQFPLPAAGRRPSLAERLQADFERECEECFNLYDTLGSGRVSVELLPQMLRSLGQYWSNHTVVRLLGGLYDSSITKIGYRTFLSLATSFRNRHCPVAVPADNIRLLVGNPAVVKELLRAFQVLSTYRRDGLHLRDMKHFLTRTGREPLSEDEWNQLIDITADRRSSFASIIRTRRDIDSSSSLNVERAREGAVSAAASAATSLPSQPAAKLHTVPGRIDELVFGVAAARLSPIALTLREGAFISMFADDVEEFL